MADTKKRKPADNDVAHKPSKKAKGKRQWQTPKHDNDGFGADSDTGRKEIEPGFSGIWATCDMHKEAKCTGDLIDLFDKHAKELYGTQEDVIEEEDIEAEIRKEISNIRKPTAKKLFEAIRLDTKCVLFFKSRAPVDPVQFVHHICTDALSSTRPKQSRWVRRLTPMTLIGRATETGLKEVAMSVLAPHFHGKDGVQMKKSGATKFAIRPNIRNHSTLTRDGVIRLVAESVGPGHKVDLKEYDLLILVEVFQRICGMSVVPADFEHLRRYNLAEIFDATPKASSGTSNKTSFPKSVPLGTPQTRVTHEAESPRVLTSEDGTNQELNAEK